MEKNIVHYNHYVNRIPDNQYSTLLKDFFKFGDKKIPAALGLLLPMILRLLGCNTVVLLHNILEQVDLESAGFTKNKLAQKIYNFLESHQT